MIVLTLAIPRPKSGFLWWRINHRVVGHPMTPTPRTPAPSVPDVRRPGAAVPLAVWLVGQTSAAEQWADRYLPGSADQPASITPELARRIVVEYSQPGELILDPCCGAGPTLIEAAARGRRAIGVDTQDSWARLAVANCEHILARDAWPLVEVITGDPRRLADLVGAQCGQVDLAVLCPPAGTSTDSSRLSAQRRLSPSSAPDTPTGNAVKPQHGNVARDAVGELVAACTQRAAIRRAARHRHRQHPQPRPVHRPGG